MRLKKTMRGYYARDMQRLPIDLPLHGISKKGEIMGEIPSLYLHLAFNGAAAAIVLMAVMTHLTFGSPLAEVLEKFNQKYSVDVAIRERLERLPADFKHYMKGGSI